MQETTVRAPESALFNLLVKSKPRGVTFTAALSIYVRLPVVPAAALVLPQLTLPRCDASPVDPVGPSSLPPFQHLPASKARTSTTTLQNQGSWHPTGAPGLTTRSKNATKTSAISLATKQLFEGLRSPSHGQCVHESSAHSPHSYIICSLNFICSYTEPT